MSRSPIMDALSNKGATSGELYIQGAKFEAELAKVKADLAECQMLESTVAGMHRETMESLAVMKAERDAAVADAERYSAATAEVVSVMMPRIVPPVIVDPKGERGYVNKAAVDAAIDAARKEGA